MRYFTGLLLSLFATVAIVAFLASRTDTDASQPFAPSFGLSASDPTPGANSDIVNTHTLPAGHHFLDSVNVFIPNDWTVASDNSIPDGDVVGEVRMDVDVNCDGTVDTLAAGDLIDTASDQSVKAEWRATIGSGWQLLFRVDKLPQNQGTEIAINMINASMPSNYCTPQTFSYTIFGTSSPGGASIITNPGPGTYTWNSAYLSYSFTGITNEHTSGSSDSVLIGAATATPTPTATATPIPGADSDADSLGLGDPLWFRDEIELFIGTDPLDPCADTATPDDEADDKLAVDLNDDQAIGVLDRALLVSQLLSGTYRQRYDLNADGVLAIQDRAIVVLYVLNFQPLGGTCTSL